MNSATEYAVKGCRIFSNGHHEMVEVWGHCVDDGQYVRYFQERRFFDLRMALYWREHPDATPAEVLHAVASAALAQSRARWTERRAEP
jgi:hypothetical protein